MGCFSITRTLFSSAVFGVIFPTVDVYSDVYLMYTTVYFVGDDLQSLGCRACFGRSEDDIYNKRLGPCTMCTTTGGKYSKNGGLSCGFLPSSMKKNARNNR